MKHTLKTIELLEQHIDLLAENGIYEIERDLLLERLRGLYASVVALEAKAEEERVLDALMGLGVAGELSTEEPEIEVERIYAEPEEEVESEEIAAPEEEVESEEIAAPEEPEEEVVFEEVAEPVAEEEIEQEPEPMAEEEPAEEEPAAYVEVESAINRYIDAIEEPAIEEPATEPEEVVATEEEPAPEEEVATEEEPAPEEEVVEEPLDVVEEKSGPEQIDHRAALSLYDDDDEDEVVELASAEEAEQEAEPVVEEEPAEEEPAASDEQVTLAELLAAEGAVDVATAASSSLSLHQSIGLNDKYILMRDLFAGDADYYESAISTLDEFDNLDDAMLYIHDNFRWSPNSEGARLLMELLACKLF